jgi:hypothetical protein
MTRRDSLPRNDIDARARAIEERGNSRKAAMEVHGSRIAGNLPIPGSHLTARTIWANRRLKAKIAAVRAKAATAAVATLAAAECERNRLALAERCASVSEAFAGDDSAGFGFTMREGRRAASKRRGRHNV